LDFLWEDTDRVDGLKGRNRCGIDIQS